jgi:hypothetical protein
LLTHFKIGTKVDTEVKEERKDTPAGITIEYTSYFHRKKNKSKNLTRFLEALLPLWPKKLRSSRPLQVLLLEPLP